MPVSGRNSSMQAAGTAKAFERKLGLPEALGLSLSIVGPSMAMAFNVSLAVRAAGRAAPLAFAIATIALGMVALAFVKFSRRVAHAGSAYAYIGHAFGWRWGFLAGWTLLLTYLSYAAGVTALIGNFLQAAVQNYGLRPSGLWFISSATGLLLAAFCAYRDVRLAGRLMLVLEALSVVAIIFLSLTILFKLAGTGKLSVASFIPATKPICAARMFCPVPATFIALPNAPFFVTALSYCIKPPSGTGPEVRRRLPRSSELGHW